ncbi:EAL domain-containing protein [Thalassotalea euphylliae]|uniref:EAL domain-containing protein n=1 Tax=Thalassotalea euphylliae TaxID=1655234 RepID=A0A3E0U612_9GAMM|nr:EAL domain-containing protein [Thalassotalea euphylliae]
MWCLLLLSVFITRSVFAISNTSLSLSNISVADGLNSASVFAVMQDTNGYLWLGTEHGVNIYDGYTMRSLSGPEGDFERYAVTQIVQDEQGIVWLTMLGKGIYRYDYQADSYQLFTDSDSVTTTADAAHQPNSGNSPWLAIGQKVLRYSQAGKQVELVLDLTEQLEAGEFIKRVYQVEQFLLVATPRGAFVLELSSGQVNHLDLVVNQAVSNMSLDGFEANRLYDFVSWRGHVFVATEAGLIIFKIADLVRYFDNLAELPVVHPNVMHGVRALYAEQDKVLVGSHEGVMQVHLGESSAGSENGTDIESNTDIKNTTAPTSADFVYQLLFRFSDINPHVAHNDVLDITKDNSGIFWFGSQSNGAYRWNPNSELIWNVEHVSTTNNSPLNEEVSGLGLGGVYAMTADSQDPKIIWASTGRVLNRINTETKTVKHYAIDLHEHTRHLHADITKLVDNGDTLWVGTQQGIRPFNKRLERVVSEPFSAATQAWLCQHHGKQYTFAILQQSLWFFGSEGAGRISLKTGAMEKLDAINKVLPPDQIQRVFADVALWPEHLVLTTQDSIWVYNPMLDSLKLVYQFHHNQEFRHAEINSLALDDNNILWVAYDGVGLFGLDGLSLEARVFIDAASTSLDEHIYGVKTDAEGHLWFASQVGFYRLDKNTRHLRQFDIGDGLATNEFNADAYAVMTDGKLAYGTMLGLSIFDPIQLHNQNEAINQDFSVNFSGVSTLSRDLTVSTFINNGQTFAFKHSDIGIRIDFATSSFLHRDTIEYRYQLVGPTEINAPFSSQHYVTFPSLSSGDYELIVRAKSPYTGELSAPSSLLFNVSYPLWRAPVVLVFYGFSVLVCLFIWLRWRANKQQELIAAHEAVKLREHRLQLALTGSDSEVWDWESQSNRIYAKRFTKDLGYAAPDTSLGFETHIDLIHPEDKELFLSKWHAFLISDSPVDSFDCSYRLQHSNGHWLWYKDIGKIVTRNIDGEPDRVTGSYSNITQTRADEERALNFGDAFKHTQDWVVIIDENFERVTVNQSMGQVFGWKNEEFDYHRGLFGLTEKRSDYYLELLPTLKNKGHYSGEELIQTPLGQEYHVLMNISVSKNKVNNTHHYIFVMTDISAQKKAEFELRQLANYDHLTGLPNRSLLLERIKHGIEQARRAQHTIALFFIDLDRFKQVNDSLGHDYGDLLLQEITARLSSALREDDTIARIGGDEFVVLVEHFKSHNDLSRIAQKIIDVVEVPVKLKSTTVSVGASIGVAMYPEDSGSQDELLRNADVAMYHAKQQGRNNFQFFTERMNLEAKQRLTMESSLKQAVRNDEFFNVYQPVIDAHTGKIIGAELLMRWQSEEGLVSPDKFIPLAEEMGLIATMTGIALDKALVLLKVWRALSPNFYLSINVSAKHFADASLVTFLENKFNDYQIPAGALKIEVTESAFMSEPEKAIETINTLSAMGCRLALDDFGTGYSSLSYIKQLPLDIIKIDRSFVSGIGESPEDEAIVDSTLVLARSLNIACVAEGVETEAQLQYLVDHQCHLIQGYFYYSPLAMDELTEKLAENKNEFSTVAKG